MPILQHIVTVKSRVNHRYGQRAKLPIVDDKTDANSIVISFMSAQSPQSFNVSLHDYVTCFVFDPRSRLASARSASQRGGAARRRRTREAQRDEGACANAQREAQRDVAQRLTRNVCHAQCLSRFSGDVRVLVSGLSCPWRPQSPHIHARKLNGSQFCPRAQCCQEVFRNIVSCVCMLVRAFSLVFFRFMSLEFLKKLNEFRKSSVGIARLQLLFRDYQICSSDVHEFRLEQTSISVGLAVEISKVL